MNKKSTTDKTIVSSVQAIDDLITAILVVKNCRLSREQKGRAEALLEIAKDMKLSDNDMLHGILLELDEMPGIGNTDELANSNDTVEYLKNLRVDLVQHLGHSDDLPIPALIGPVLTEKILRT